MRAAPFAIALVVSLLAGCGDGREGPTPVRAKKPVVYTTFYPTTYFAERIGSDLVEVVCPVPDDEDAIFWHPDAETLGRYQAADMILVNGAGFEKWVAKVSLPITKVVDTAAAIEGDLIRFEEAVTHTHGPAGAHTHEGIDGHTWLDPLNAKAQAGAVHEALVRLLPGSEDALTIRYEALIADLDDLDESLLAVVEGYEGETILASHPAYNYIARRYGWSVVNLNLDPAEMPDDEQFASIAARQETSAARFLLWESDPSGDVADRFQRELGLTSVVFSPCELLSADERAGGADYLSVMRGNVERIAQVFQRGE